MYKYTLKSPHGGIYIIENKSKKNISIIPNAITPEIINLMTDLGGVVLEKTEFERLERVFPISEKNIILLPSKWRCQYTSEKFGRDIIKIPDIAYKHIIFSQKKEYKYLKKALDTLGFVVLNKFSYLDHIIRSAYSPFFGSYEDGVIILAPNNSENGILSLSNNDLKRLKRVLKIKEDSSLQNVLKNFKSLFLTIDEYNRIFNSELVLEYEENFIILPPGWNFVSERRAPAGENWIVDDLARKRFKLISSQDWPNDIKIISPICRITVSRDEELYCNNVIYFSAAIENKSGRGVKKGDYVIVLCETQIIHTEDDAEAIKTCLEAEEAIESFLNENYPNWKDPYAYWEENFV